MKEYVVIRNFTDKYTNEEYIIGKRLILNEERAEEMNHNRKRVVEVFEDEFTKSIVENISIVFQEDDLKNSNPEDETGNPNTEEIPENSNLEKKNKKKEKERKHE